MARRHHQDVEARVERLNDATFERLVGELRSDLYRFATWLTRDATLAEDVVQIALMRAWRSLHSLKDAQAVKPWLWTIVRREALRTFTRKRYRIVNIEELTGARELRVATVDRVDSIDLRRGILKLNRRYREPLLLQVVMGHSAAEIAEMLGLTKSTVLVRLFRARQTLAAHFEE